MALYCQIWARPGAPTFGRVIDFIPNPYQTLHDGMNIVGDGVLQVPNTFDRFDEILLIDEATPANCVSSLVRIFDDSDPTTPIFEWLPSAILPTTDKFDPNIDISGEGIKSIMKYARVEAWDWDGSLDFVPTFPDWIYGGGNLIGNPGFETSVCRPEVNEITIDRTVVTGGTFTISDGTDTTSGIAWDASAGTVEMRIEADLGLVDDVLVQGSGGVGDPYVIEFVNPCTFAGGLTFDGAGLTPSAGDSELARTQFGALQPNPWTKSQTVSRGVQKVFGKYDNFRVTQAQAHTGTWSLLINPASISSVADRFTGTQQVLSVQENGLYQASIWFYPTNANDQFRLVIRGIDNDLVQTASGGDALVQGSGTANSWNQFTITDVDVEDRSQVIFRFANINNPDLGHPTDPSTFYVDDGEFKEGQAAATIGKIIGDLYDDATSEHSGRVVWEDESNPGNPYLTLDFTDSVDSAGNAWFHDEIEIKLWMRMTYLQVLDQFVQTYGYEWRVVPDSVENGTWYLQIYNPGGMQVDYTTAASPGIQTGSRDTRRSVRRFVPSGTQFLVEGTDRITARDEDTDLATALGRIETSRISRQLPSITAAGDAAFEDKVDALVNGLTYTYTLTDPEEVPLSDYLIGDALHIEDPPQVSDNARLIDVEIVVSPDSEEFEVQFSPQSAAGS